MQQGSYYTDYLLSCLGDGVVPQSCASVLGLHVVVSGSVMVQ